jgi:SIR2-like protein
MRFLPSGPDVPTELIAAQEKGQVIFVCGAGVSRGAGLPTFRGLVERVYELLGEDWNLHIAEREGMKPDGRLANQYDRVLRSLERRLIASDAPRRRGMRERIRSAVRQALAAPEGADLSNHLALLELSRDAEGRIRLLTTNFDTLFERAWFDAHGSALPSHAGIAMPQPNSAGCTGVLHLHGRLSDRRRELGADETDLVLTSAEFGDAYLRLGWASRYIYDVVRAHTLVLVGYQADDPPMRYLLEALEADRERYPDLQKVYAFAPCEAGQEETERALWSAKAVEPILYVAPNHDHGALYETLREWRDYADDPTAWRRAQLQGPLGQEPGALAANHVERCVELLGHGDAVQLLGELSPSASWLPVLAEKRVFDRAHAMPGAWIASKVNDAGMIRACAGLSYLDDQARWQIDRALERERSALSPVRMKAWRLMLPAKRRRDESVLDDSWYVAAPAIKSGQVDFEARRLVGRILRPRLAVRKPSRWNDAAEGDGPETLWQLMWLDFDPAGHPPADDILGAWPAELEHEIALFGTLDRVMLEALEEAEDIGLVEDWDRTSYDVPSVARHPQNAHHKGFHPVTRALADLWHRIADRDAQRGRRLVKPWEASPYLLRRRLFLFAVEHESFSAAEALDAVDSLGDEDFWMSGAQVELMRVLVGRWAEFDAVAREDMEERLRGGPPRALYGRGGKDDAEWQSIWDHSVYRRLKRIESAGGVLTPASQSLLAEISGRHPKWQPGAGDRDDFDSWHEMRSGPSGHPELLAGISDEQLVAEAMRLQRERHFEEGDIWRVFCSADPERALRGLGLEAQGDRWEPDAWRCLLWAANEKGDAEFQFALADLLLRMPRTPLRELLPSAASWLQRRREDLSAQDRAGGARFLPLWDRFAALAYDGPHEPDVEGDDDDLDTHALNRPGGQLAWALLDALSTPKPKPGSGLGAELAPRFDKLAAAGGRAGLLARVYLIRFLAYFDAIDPAWTETNLTSRLAWDHTEALPLWRAYAHGEIGSARLFNRLKPMMLEAFARKQLSDDEYEGLVSKLLSVCIWHQHGNNPEYALTASELKRALTVGPASARQNVSWNLWRMVAKEDGASEDHATRWRTIIGPIFRGIWPLDAKLRSKGTTRNLVLMALECEGAFPEAVEAILDFIIPYELYALSHSLRLEKRHDGLVNAHPRAFVRLANALIDPAAFPVPSDLAELLQQCVAADLRVASDPAFVRLYSLRRQRNA